MLAISVELLLGTYRADPVGLAHTGRLAQGEWPPAPLRLLAALVAADGTRDRSRHTTGAELAFLEAARPPRIYASAPPDVHHQPLEGRFVVWQKGKATKSSHQEYQGRSGALVRPGVRVTPRNPSVTYLWDEVVTDQILAGLRARAARVGYLGAADSPVAVRVSLEAPGELPGEEWVPDEAGDLVVGVPRPGVVAAMDAHYDRWCAEGPSVHRSQSPGLRRLAAYRSPGAAVTEEEPRPVVLWLTLDQALSGRRVTVVTAAFKAAVLDLHQRAIGEPPPFLHGHVPPGTTDYRLACFLALPDVGHRRAAGLIRGLALVLPTGTPPEAVADCRSALDGLNQLRGPGFRVGVRPWSGESRPLAANPVSWTRPSKRFMSAFPVLHERRGGAVTLSEIERWCAHAGLPRPVRARSARSPFLSGGVDLRPVEVNRPGRPGLPYSHLDLVFESDVSGPVVLGSGRQRGLGLCWPVALDGAR